MTTLLDGIEACGLHHRTPYGITNVSQTQLSIARHYGGIQFQGERYTYLPPTDELIRDDVLKWQQTQKREAPRAARAKAQACQKAFPLLP